MSILAYFPEWKVSAIPQILTEAPDSNGNWVETLTPGTAINGVKYNRGAAERYFSQTWAEDVSDVFATDTPGSLAVKDKLSIGGIVHDIESFVDVAVQGEVYLFGLKVHKK